MPVDDRPSGTARPRQIWRHLRVGMRLLLRRPTPCVSLIPLLPDGRILLVRRTDTGQWSLPGGIIDWGETAEEAARRELREETGLELVAVRRLVGVYSSPDRDPRAHALSISMAVDVRGEPRIHDSHEVGEVGAFAPGELPVGRLAHDHDQQLRDFFAGHTVLR